MHVRDYDPARDYADCLRVYREVGWIDTSEEQEAAFKHYIADARMIVSELRGQAECMVTTMPGTVRYLESELPFCAVTGVTTGRVARRQGLGRALTAEALKRAAEAGEPVAMLGIFDQGFYDSLGFGMGSYDHFLRFDPATLNVSGVPEIPVNLAACDDAAIHRSRLLRRRIHGNCNITPAGHTAASVRIAKGGFGIGFRDAESGELMHHFWAVPEGEHGPLRIEWAAYRDREQFLELLRLIRALSDQVHLVEMVEPAGVVLQSFLKRPFRTRSSTRGGAMENRMTGSAHWQIRILDLQRCVAATRLCGAHELELNLTLSDPIEEFCNSSGWNGVAGDYTLRLGASSAAEPGHRAGLPVLRCSVNTFSRLWFGAADAETLRFSGELEAPEATAEQLSRLWRLPTPKLDWDF